MRRYLPPPQGPLFAQRQLLLALGLAGTGLLAWWITQTTPGASPEKPARPRLPDYVVQHFEAVETNKSGKPERRLRADELRHFADDDISELDRPRLELLQTEGPSWLARSDRGLVLAGGEQIRLLGDVQIDREASDQTRSAHLETEEIDVWRSQSLAETSLPVRIRSDGDTLSAKGMRLWYSEPNRSTFHGRTRIRLAPEQETSP